MADREQLAAALERCRAALAEAARVVPFTPAGSDQPTLPVPLEIEWSEDDKDRACAAWDEFAADEDEDLIGLLESDVVNGE